VKFDDVIRHAVQPNLTCCVLTLCGHPLQVLYIGYVCIERNKQHLALRE